MSEDQVNGVNKPDAGSERDSDDAIVSEKPVSEKPISPSFETYRKTVSEAKKERAKRRELEQRLAEFKAERQAEEQAKLAEQGKYKELLEAEKKKYAELQSKYEKTERTINNSFKFNALKKALNAEIDYKWADYLEAKGIYDQIELDDNRRADEMSLAKVSEFIRKEYPEIIAKPMSKGDLPNQSPVGSSGTISYEEWQKLPLKDKKARMKDVVQVLQSGKN
jgi:hypothetical protein